MYPQVCCNLGARRRVFGRCRTVVPPPPPTTTTTTDRATRRETKRASASDQEGREGNLGQKTLGNNPVFFANQTPCNRSRGDHTEEGGVRVKIQPFGHPGMPAGVSGGAKHATGVRVGEKRTKKRSALSCCICSEASDAAGWQATTEVVWLVGWLVGGVRALVLVLFFTSHVFRALGACTATHHTHTVPYD